LSTGFWIGAAGLGSIAAGFLIVPLWRDRQRQGNWSYSGLISAFAIVPVAIVIYVQISTWRADPGLDVASEEGAMVAELAAKMVENPDDVNGWLLLGRSYMVLGEHVLGRQAYSEAFARTPNPDNALKVAFGEALILSNQGSLAAQAGNLIEDVLRTEPTNQKALWYGGFVAIERGREDLAKTRWTALMNTNPPPDIADILRSQLASLGGPVSNDAQPTLAADGPVIRLNVSLDAELSTDGFGPNASLFIFARASAGGPPLAVIRRPVSAVPGEFTLTDQDTMIAGRSLADYPELSLVARLSVSGEPIAQSGDLYAETTYSSADGEAVELVIDQVVP